MASAFRFYTAFCELRRTPPFPAQEEAVLQRSSVFNDTPTFGDYVCLSERRCYFLRFPTTWKTPCVDHVARGLRKCQDRSFRFSNFIRGPLLLEIIDHDTRGSDFAQAAFFSFLFTLRVPSEASVLRRAYASDPSDTFCPQPDKALMNVKMAGGEPFLFAKFSWRKNLPSGCILRRPCFCYLANRKDALICPIHVFWQLIRCRVDPGQPIFSSVNRRNFNRILKAVMAKLHIPEADMYSSHAFRRGAAQELKESGSHWSVVASSGAWHSPAFRGYVDLSRDVELGPQQMFDGDMDSQPEEEGLLGTAMGLFAAVKPLGRSAPTDFPWVSGFSLFQLAVDG